MKAMILCKRTAKEILRDPLSFFFSLGFPLVIMGLLTVIQRNIPASLFELPQLAPGITVFGLSFSTLFSASLIAKDRASALLLRLYTTPLRASDYILGYLLPLLPLALAQTAITLLAALILGLPWSWNLGLVLLANVPTSMIFIGLGLLCGSVLTDRQVGGFCGALLTNLTGWLSGIWFDLNLVGGAFKTVAAALPFYHAVELAKGAYAGTFTLSHLLWVVAYAVVINILAVFAFLRQMKKN